LFCILALVASIVMPMVMFCVACTRDAPSGADSPTANPPDSQNESQVQWMDAMEGDGETSIYGYISEFDTADHSFILNKIEWLTTANDTDRLREIGIDPEELPNGFYIQEYPDISAVRFPFNADTEFRIIDYPENNGQHKRVTSDEFSQLLSERESLGKRTLCIIEWKGEVVGVLEQYLP